MEERTIKFRSKETNKFQLHAIPGHFATSHSHINYYIDVTSIKTRASEAKEAARIFYSYAPKHQLTDTIVCMDGTEVIGTFLSQEIESYGLLSNNSHDTIYVVSPEVNSSNQIIFRDNNKKCIEGKVVVLLLATATTGETIRRALECIRYYGGHVAAIAAIFSTIDEIEGIHIDRLFGPEEVMNYEAYNSYDCPYCKQGQRIEAIVNGFGYSVL